MYLSLNEENEVLGYAIVGGIEGGILVSDALLPKLVQFRSRKYLYVKDYYTGEEDIVFNVDWVDPWDSEKSFVAPITPSNKELADELEHAKKTIDQQQAILNSLASTIIKQQLNTEDKEDK